MKKLLPALSIICIVALSGCVQEEIAPVPQLNPADRQIESESTGSQNSYNKLNSPRTAEGIIGSYDDLVGRCIPPKANCAGQESSNSPAVIQGLQAAVDSQTLSAFWASNLGTIYLNSIDPRVKEDVLSGIITLKRFDNELLFVFPDAETPWEGYDYSVPGDERTLISH